ncbi:Aromatic-L-amino-acid decarboxylase [Lamellibrachia satsuma]|nr:Aromatic-L-amino-acid decarboxylase [Lamellibrachia satsuma]
MDAEEFSLRAKEVVDYVASYRENIRQRRPLPNVEPGYLKALVPETAPDDPETWKDVFEDFERVIMPGITHWQNPQFHAYYALGNSYPAICGNILCDGIDNIGFSWMACPASTELEVVVMDWLGKMLQLPSEFLSVGKGGGIIQGSASEVTLMTLLTARSHMLSIQTKKKASRNTGENSGINAEVNSVSKAVDEDLSKGADEDVSDGVDGDVFSRLVAYSSDQAHSSVAKACILGAVRLHKVKSNDKEEMTGTALAKAIDSDVKKGLIPFYCVATLGTTPTCAFDDLQQIGPVCEKAGVWLHTDAAYAGASFICPEFRPLLGGVEFADSFNFNPHKWLLTNFECSALWYRDATHVVNSFNVDGVYLRHEQAGNVPEFRHWEIPLGRRFRSLKLWFVLRMFGVKGLQTHIRKHVELAHEFEKLVRADDRFEVTHRVTHGLVCFRLRKCSNELNALLLSNLTKDGRVYLVASCSKGVYFLRFAVCAKDAESSDIRYSWDVIRQVASALLEDKKHK